MQLPGAPVLVLVCRADTGTLDAHPVRKGVHLCGSSGARSLQHCQGALQESQYARPVRPFPLCVGLPFPPPCHPPHARAHARILLEIVIVRVCAVYASGFSTILFVLGRSKQRFSVNFNVDGFKDCVLGASASALHCACLWHAHLSLTLTLNVLCARSHSAAVD